MGRASAITLTAGLCLAALAAGCGGQGGTYRNTPRPPEPIQVSVAINDGRLAVSPRMFGAGPVTLIATNQSDAARAVTLETDEIASGPGVRQTTGPINPGDTATLKADLTQGSYALRVDGGAVAPSSLDVGAPRPSAQDQLLQP